MFRLCLVDIPPKRLCNLPDPAIETQVPAVTDAAIPDDESDFEPDPLFVDSLRESKWILGMWLTCFAWTLTVCLTQGYPGSVDPETFPMVLGIPAWVAYGIALPWCLANIATLVFCLGYMRDGDLGGEVDSDADTAIEQGVDCA